MKPILNYTTSEKEKIRDWKQSLPKNESRKFTLIFMENGKYSEDEYKLYCKILSDDKYSLIVCENVELN